MQKNRKGEVYKKITSDIYRRARELPRRAKARLR